jgi:hypothetical protein
MKMERQARNNIVKKLDNFADSNTNFQAPLLKVAIRLRCRKGRGGGKEKETKDSGAATPCTLLAMSESIRPRDRPVALHLGKPGCSEAW